MKGHPEHCVYALDKEYLTLMCKEMETTETEMLCTSVVLIPVSASLFLLASPVSAFKSLVQSLEAVCWVWYVRNSVVQPWK